LATSVTTPETRARVVVPSKRSTRHERVWVMLVCLLLGISGGVRYWRDAKFQVLSKESELPPFPLSDFPTVLGDWHAVEGSERTLEPEVARIAGSSDSIERRYIDEKNGEQVVVLILYGLAPVVWPHVPEGCYPAVGFTLMPDSADLPIKIPDTNSQAIFRVQRFAKIKMNQVDTCREVAHSFLNAGRWGIDWLKEWKSFRYHPGMFKVQVQREVSPVGKPDDTSLKLLLGRIVAEIEHRSSSRG
jgi:hypothetical protein